MSDLRMPAVVMAAISLLAGQTIGQQPAPTRPAGAPSASALPLPHRPGDNAIWGATGQDSSGHIWFGISTGGLKPNSARLVEYDPAVGRFTEHGDVMAALTTAGLARPGEQQAKIHSKIVEGPGRFLYFASMDEDGENPDGSKLPTWGGHLWRLSRATNQWQHLLRAPEALIAVGAGGKYVYALGYFDHVLYQYDTQTARTARVAIGSVDGHISRNLVVDDRGHAFVPRLTSTGNDPARSVQIALVEIGSDLRERHATPIAPEHYLGSNRPTDTHGIVGLQTMADRSILFTTHAGRLFRVVPPARPSQPATVVDAGWIHPRGTSYPASLFTSDGKSSIATSARASNDPGPWDWVSCGWPTLVCTARPLVPEQSVPDVRRTLLYGSSTRDARGGHYLVGMDANYRPVVLRVQDQD